MIIIIITTVIKKTGKVTVCKRQFLEWALLMPECVLPVSCLFPPLGQKMVPVCFLYFLEQNDCMCWPYEQASAICLVSPIFVRPKLNHFQVDLQIATKPNLPVDINHYKERKQNRSKNQLAAKQNGDKTNPHRSVVPRVLSQRSLI